MQSLNIKGKKWSVGLEWEILPGDDTIKAEAKMVAEKTLSKFGVLVGYDNHYAIGLTKKLSKEPSAALYLALANQEAIENGMSPDYPDWVVLEEAGDDKYWMSVIKSGIPAPQFDAILSITDIKDRITELLINDTYTVHSSAGEIIAIFEGIKHIENKSLNDLTADVRTKIKFEKYLGIPNSVIYAGFGVVLAGLLGYGALEFVEGRSLAEKAANIAQQQERERQEKERLYQQELKSFNDNKERSVNVEMDKVIAGLSGNPSKILTAFYENVGNSEVGTHGWDLKTIECYLEVSSSTPTIDPTITYPRLACDYLYNRTPLATTRMLLEDFPDAKLNGDKAVVTKVVEIEPQYIAKADRSIVDSLKLSKDWGFDVQSQLQLLKVADIEHEIKGTTEISYSTPGKPLSPTEIAAGQSENKAQVNNLDIGVGEIVIKGNTFDWVKELADNVDFSGTGIKKVIFTVRGLGDLSWEAKFNYYVKTKDGGIGSSSSVGLNNSQEPNKNVQATTQ